MRYLILLLLFLFLITFINVSSAVTTTRFNCSAQDGWVSKVDDASWDASRDAKVGSSVDNTSGFGDVALVYYFSLTPVYFFNRGFLYCDTSGLPDEAIIDEVDLWIFDAGTGESNVSVQKGTQDAPLSVNHFNNFTGDYYNFTDWGTNKWNKLTFNAQGRSDINKTDVTTLCLREYDHDYQNNSFTTAMSGFENDMVFTETGVTYVHFLNITYRNNSCEVPLSGNWDVDATDLCDWTTPQNVPGNMYITGDGEVTLSSTFTFTGSNQIISVGSGSSLVIKSGGSIA